MQFAREPEYKDICDSVYSIILFGAPHRGLNTTALEVLVQGKRRERLIKDLKYDSSFLQTLSKAFSQISTRLKIISCYELLETPTAKAKENNPELWDRSGPTAMMVEPGSARLFTSNETEIGIDANHSNIAKLKRDSEAYQRVRELMAKHVDSAPHIIDSQFSRRDTVDVLADIDKIGRGLMSALPSSLLSMATAQSLSNVLDFFGQFKDFLQDQVSSYILIRDSVSMPFARRILKAVREVQVSLSPYASIASHQRSIPWTEQSMVHGNWSLSTSPLAEPLLEVRRISNLHDVASRCAIHVRLLTTFAMLGIEESVSIETIGRSPAAQILGIDRTAWRQRLIGRASENLEANFEPLQGFYEPKDPTSGMEVASFSPDPSTEELDVIVEYRRYGQDQMSLLERSLEQTFEAQEALDKSQLARLASLLRKLTEDLGDHVSEISSALPAPCVLKCLGYIDQPNSVIKKVAILFQPPAGIAISSIRSLHSVLGGKFPLTALEQRFKIAWGVCSAVLSIHSWGWLHKSIRSENILLVPTIGALGLSAYFRGFEHARHVEDASIVSTTASTRMEQDRDLYRHPDRQGKLTQPIEGFEKKHDLYAVGVVLLEIGTLRTIKAMIGPWRDSFKLYPKPEEIAQKIQLVAKENLPRLMGSRYAELVRRCLEGDFETSNPGADDPSDIALSMSFHDFMLQGIESGCRI